MMRIGTICCLVMVVLCCLETIPVSSQRRSRPRHRLVCGLSEETFQNGYFTLKSRRGQRDIYKATCNSGFTMHGRAEMFCSTRTNTFRKRRGYDNAACRDVDECLTAEAAVCHHNATCENLPGTYACHCNEGYRGNGRTQCREAIECPRLVVPSRGQLQLRRDGTVAEITCDEDYIIHGDTLTCDWTTGVWQGQHPRCMLAFDNCGAPEVPEHGRKVGRCHSEGCQVTFLCNEGYWLDGPLNRLCLAGQIWSDYTPVCRPAGVAGVAFQMKEHMLDKLDLFTSTSESVKKLRQGRLALHNAGGIDLVLMFDKSSSVAPGNFMKGINFTIFVLEQFGIANVTGTTRVAAITYGDEATLEFNLDDEETFGDMNATKRRLLQIQAGGGGTATAAAFLEVQHNILPLMEARPEAKRVIFIITDGHTTIGSDPIALAGGLRIDNKFEIYAIGVGDAVDRRELRSIASEPYTEHVYPLAEFADLAELADKLLELKPDYKKCGVPGNIEQVNQEDQQGNQSSVQYANQGAWPWLVMISAPGPEEQQDIFGDESIRCTGALICTGWVITAAECLELRDLNNAYVRPYNTTELTLTMGEHRWFNDEGTEQTSGVRHIYRHPDYQFGGSQHNLALLELSTTFHLNKYVRTVCVPSSQGDAVERMTLRNSQVWFAGWGTMGARQGKFAPLPADAVQQVQLPILRTRYCQDFAGDRYSDSAFCAGNHYQIEEPCRGDTGGPLVGRREDQRFLLRGMAMSLPDCSDINQYGLFTDVLSYGDWIMDTTVNCTLEHL